MNEMRKLMEALNKIGEEIKSGIPGGRPFIDLSGPDGNAFVIMGRAKQYAKELGLDGDAIVAEMKQGDYENLLKIFDSYFGDYVDLYRGDSEENIDEEFGIAPGVRQATNRLYKLMDEEMIDPRVVADAAIHYMSEDDVKDMVRSEGFFPDNNFEESVEIVGEAYDDEVSGEVKFRDCADMVKSMLRDMQKLERNTSRVYREAQQSEGREDFSQMLLNELGETLHEITDLVEKYEDAYVSHPRKIQ